MLLWRKKPNQNRAVARREIVVTLRCFIVRGLWELSKDRRGPPTIAIVVFVTLFVGWQC